MRGAYYSCFIRDFLITSNEEIIGNLNLANTQFASQWTIATTSWDSSVQLLKNSFLELTAKHVNASNWYLLLEYEIPRLQSRIDAVVLADDLIFVIEFKYERKKYELADVRQAEDYALDLHDFHMESREKTIVPILFSPLAKSMANDFSKGPSKLVKDCVYANATNLAQVLNNAYIAFHHDLNKPIDHKQWEESIYSPTPTIIQAATSLFAGQGVKEITNKGAENLDKTSTYLIEVINQAKENNKKIICFVTGVPGAGKTLVGLDVVHEKDAFGGTDTNTAYFSGNVPLVNVLREALARDDYNRQQQLYEKGDITKRPVKGDSERQVKSKIQNLHQFIKYSINRKTAPVERIVVFDEAQRCWNAKQFSNKAKQNRNRETNPFAIEEKSEAEFIFEFMSRHEGWAVIIALIGGGQEINTGEGGIAEWGKAIQTKYQNWEIHISPQLIKGDSTTDNQTLFEDDYSNLIIRESEHLHLSVSQRSFKAANLNNWVQAVIANDTTTAMSFANSIQGVYPLCITRDIDKAKQWLRNRKAGSKRIGMLASSGGLRLKPYGIQVRDTVEEALWFLNDERDIRSSYYLELTATEYKVQGLEIDLACICWDADLRRKSNEWDFKNFSGTNWQENKSLQERIFLLNTYRVLLTRAREGIIVFVPEGDSSDYTRLPEFYNPIFTYLKDCGMQEI
ncbi:MAG: DUF2075 domain-containing protein [Chitinophagaceae bacterium]|nr:DUF2075 domain-containing protein [Chitinophagaceae bacterium]